MVQDLWHVGEQLGVRAGETLCHITYLDMSCSLVCMPISHARTETQTHAAATPSKIIVASISENVETQTGSFTRMI